MRVKKKRKEKPVKKATTKKTPRRKSTKSPTSKLSLIDMQCRRHSRLILLGRVLAIDPAVGSDSSQPGYAVGEAGVLLDKGHIYLGTKEDKSVARRLQALRRSLLTEFEPPDIIIIERVVVNPKVPAYCNASVVKLNQAIGVVMSLWDVPVVEVSPASWKVTAKKWTAYTKTDANDAAAMWLCVMEKAKLQEEEK